jgi:hypothetical protein
MSAAKEGGSWGLFVFATTMWWLQWKRNEARDKEYAKLSEKLIAALTNVKATSDTTNLLLQTILTRRAP